MATILRRVGRLLRMRLAEPLQEATDPDLTKGSARSLTEAVAEAFGELNPEVLVAGIFCPPH